MPKLSDRLAELQIRDRDTFILYVAAHGVSFNDRAYLMCGNFDLAKPDDGLYPVDQLLSEFIEGLPSAATKLLILDAGQLDHDPRLGIVVNDFPRLLEEQVKQTNDASLWVLCSHSAGQKSHLSRARGGSVFGTFVAEGLRGKADLNNNDVVDTLELDRFVSDNVSAWVAQFTDDEASQNPRLWWGGERKPAAAEDGSAAAEEKSAVDLLSLKGMRAELRDVEVTVPPVAERRIDEAPRGLLARAAQDQEGSPAPVGAAEKQGPPAGVPSQGQPPATQGAPVAAAQPDTGAAQEPATDGPGDTKSDDAKKTDERERLRALVADAWRLRDQLANDAGTDPQSLSRAIDETPHLWREFQEELVAYEDLVADAEDQEIASPSLLAVLEKQAQIRELLGLASAKPSLSMANRQIALADLRSLALAKLAVDHGWHESPVAIDEVLAALDGIINLPPAEFTKWIKEKTTWEAYYDQYYELRLVKQLAASADLDPTLFQLALRTRREGERVAAIEPWCSPWLHDIESADRLRLAGEHQILDRIGSAWPQHARDYLSHALELYRIQKEEFQDIARASRLRNDLVFRVPYYVRWHQAAVRGR